MTPERWQKLAGQEGEMKPRGDAATNAMQTAPVL